MARSDWARYLFDIVILMSDSALLSIQYHNFLSVFPSKNVKYSLIPCLKKNYCKDTEPLYHSFFNPLIASLLHRESKQGI